MPDLLLVDNDARITELTAWFLRRSGHEVRIADSYADARLALRERAPDLLLADLELGRESGREELPRLSAEGLLPPTLVVSGFLDPELEEELDRIPGIVGTVSKPFDMQALEQEIARHLASLLMTLPTSPLKSPPGTEPVPETDLTPPTPPPDDDGWVEIVPLREDRP